MTEHDYTLAWGLYALAALGCLLVGFTLYQLRILSRVEFRANREGTA